MSNFKILLISDSALNVNGGGISQTLANIFSGIPADQLLILSAEEELKSAKQDHNFANQTIFFKRQPLPQLKNRLGLYFNKYIRQLSSFLFIKFRIPELTRIRKYDPDLIIICAQGNEGIILGEKVNSALQKPMCIYFMDDWFADKETKWYGGSLTSSVKNLLQNASGWIMISEYLAETLSKRYSVQNKPLLVLHNPVDPWINSVIQDLGETKTLDIAYAGALWPMHLDAFLLIAKGLNSLKESGIEGKLTLYCKENFWMSNSRIFEDLPVFYGGFLPYDQVYPSLAKHTYALVCSSFDKENKYLTASSVQTKITDYMNAERVIISIGPDYGACNKFVDKHNIGYSIASSDVESIKSKLLYILNDIEGNRDRVEKGKSLIKKYYSKKSIVNNLNHFFSTLLK